MEWLEVTIKTISPAIDLLGARLTAIGYDSFIIDDSEDFSEFLKDNTQYWDYVDEDLARKMQNVSQIRLYLPHDAQAPEQIAQLKSELEAFRAQNPDTDLGSLEVSLQNLQEEDWEESWKQYYQPIPIGERLLIVPQWLSPENPEHRIPVVLDPGMIFGTGAHASTQMCLQALEQTIHGGERVIDLGSGSAILDTDAVRQLISRAESAQMHLVAMMSCLNDSAYALSHTSEALAISGGALWMNSAGSYWLDPTNADVQNYLAGMIHQLEAMGFQEVILNNFSFPTTDEIVYSSDSTRESMLQDAYKALENKVGLDCTLGLLIKDPESGHQAFDLAEHLYVYYSDGSSLKQYVDDHPDTYLVFLTASHDTRFDDYGKVYTQQSVDYFSSLPDLDFSSNDTADTTETSPEP